MQTRVVGTVTSNEGYVRLRIFAGDLKVDEAAAELIRLERAQHDSTKYRLNEAIDEIFDLRKQLKLAARKADQQNR